MAAWVSAGATVALALLATVLAVVGVRLHGVHARRAALAEQRWLDHRAERDRAQAELVAAWPISERETFQKVVQRGVVGAAVRNASALPVYDVEIVYHDPPAAWAATRWVRVVPPAGAPEVYAGFDSEETVGEPSRGRVNPDGSIRLAASAQMAVELRFTDAGGRRWQRDAHGALACLGAAPVGGAGAAPPDDDPDDPTAPAAGRDPADGAPGRVTDRSPA
jgi:hypothetical protein